MTKIQKLEQQLKELKLAKRQLILAGKKTENLDGKIRAVEDEIKVLIEQIKVN